MFSTFGLQSKKQWKISKTLVDWTLLFDTAEMRETMVKVHKAEEGQKQNFDKLEIYLSKHRVKA